MTNFVYNIKENDIGHEHTMHTDSMPLPTIACSMAVFVNGLFGGSESKALDVYIQDALLHVMFYDALTQSVHMMFYDTLTQSVHVMFYDTLTQSVHVMFYDTLTQSVHMMFYDTLTQSVHVMFYDTLTQSVHMMFYDTLTQSGLERQIQWPPRTISFTCFSVYAECLCDLVSLNLYHRTILASLFSSVYIVTKLPCHIL